MAIKKLLLTTFPLAEKGEEKNSFSHNWIKISFGYRVIKITNLLNYYSSVVVESKI